MSCMEAVRADHGMLRSATGGGRTGRLESSPTGGRCGSHRRPREPARRDMDHGFEGGSTAALIASRGVVGLSWGHDPSATHLR
jgi:hypothetical protein